jgi:hypothetical protein
MVLGGLAQSAPQPKIYTATASLEGNTYLTTFAGGAQQRIIANFARLLKSRSQPPNFADRHHPCLFFVCLLFSIYFPQSRNKN